MTIATPGLVFAAWNLFYHRASNISFRPELFLTALICSIAPAMYEEVLFRGILIDRLQKNGQTSMMTMILSALLFALV
ncbi:MAG: CPBP family intramembrane metalloprotease, partial [Solobacterium sp.]|nr:CPBP family intramembrane metalloprotease [Solobacterium sp.]